MIALIAQRYKLTARETDMLECLSRAITNEEIASELSLSEEGVRSGVHRLMKKIPVIERSKVPTWVETYGKE